jgi:hypothetical protein
MELELQGGRSHTVLFFLGTNQRGEPYSFGTCILKFFFDTNERSLSLHSKTTTSTQPGPNMHLDKRVTMALMKMSGEAGGLIKRLALHSQASALEKGHTPTWLQFLISFLVF